ncbi:MAG: hypothetical protein EPN47_07370 [Acidobacteria bacterium]|nr:MAG: hypothetical protein EPN47_07370 [Acidobacteriota bacterium]
MSTTVSAASARGLTVQREQRERLFYLIAGLAMIIGVAAGFHMFYLHGRNDAGEPVTQQIAPLVYVHAAFMTCWMVLFLLQCGLVMKGNRRLHMRVGKAAVVLYAVIIPIGVITALLQIRYADPGSFPPFGPYRFLTLPLAEIANFTFFVGVAFLFRRRPEVHRPFMMMGTLSVAEAGMGRIGYIRNAFFQSSHAAFFPTFWGSTVTVALVLWLVKFAMTRRLDRHFSTALALFVASGLLSSYVSTTAWWFQLAQRMTH